MMIKNYYLEDLEKEVLKANLVIKNGELMFNGYKSKHDYIRHLRIKESTFVSSLLNRETYNSELKSVLEYYIYEKEICLKKLYKYENIYIRTGKRIKNIDNSIITKNIILNINIYIECKRRFISRILNYLHRSINSSYSYIKWNKTETDFCELINSLFLTKSIIVINGVNTKKNMFEMLNNCFHAHLNKQYSVLLNQTETRNSDSSYLKTLNEAENDWIEKRIKTNEKNNAKKIKENNHHFK